MMNPNSNYHKQTVLFFYKKTMFPQVVDAPDVAEKFTKTANEMIVNGLKHGVSMEQQKEEYISQLDLMEEALTSTAGGGEMDGETIGRAMVMLGEAGLQMTDLQRFYNIWCLNICALLKMKAIKNDNDNGILKMTC